MNSLKILQDWTIVSVPILTNNSLHLIPLLKLLQSMSFEEFQ